MKNSRSLSRNLLIYIIGAGAFLVLLYTFFLHYYFILGLESHTKYMLDQEAKFFSRQYEAALQNDTPLPEIPTGPNFYGTLSKDELPQEVLTLFPAETHRHRQMLTHDDASIDYYLKPNPMLLPGLCGGKHCELIFLYTHKLKDQKTLYLLMGLGEEDFDQEQDKEFISTMFMTIPVGAMLLLFTISLSFILTRRIGTPIKGLADWAANLTLDNMDKPAPHFYYQELDLIASKLQEAFSRIAQVLENEHRFLRNASHELRTPIAVMSGNLELLAKLAENTQQDIEDSSEGKAIARLQRAVLNMKKLTETLLWLSREEENMPSPEPVNLNDLVASLVEENQYLLENKQVTVTITTSEHPLSAPATPCRIILTNLIRNAFQYTQDGEVNIDIGDACVTVKNCSSSQSSSDGNNSDYGFGLGLALVEQIANKLHWQYKQQSITGGRCARIGFTSCDNH